MQTPLTLLNQLTAEQFLADYWQKKPLLIRQAIPGFAGLLDANELAGLACEDEAQSRIIQHKKGQWSVKQGPFDDKDFAKLPERDWTLLVQSVDIHNDAACELMNQFRFIPDVRLDDMMISLATAGGGVGPHFDSYDVFLLQAHGRRRWQFGQQKDLTLVPNLPLKILKNFLRI